MARKERGNGNGNGNGAAHSANHPAVVAYHRILQAVQQTCRLKTTEIDESIHKRRSGVLQKLMDENQAGLQDIVQLFAERSVEEDSGDRHSFPGE